MQLLLAAFCLLLAISGARDSYADNGGGSQLTIRKNFNRLIESKSCRSCDLSGVDLNRVDLSGADLEGAHLVGAKLFLTNLSGADLRNADLQGAGLGGADLAGADLRGANLTGAMLGGAYLTGAIFDNDAFSLSSDKKKSKNDEKSISRQSATDSLREIKKHEVVVRKRRDFEHAPLRLSEYFSKRDHGRKIKEKKDVIAQKVDVADVVSSLKLNNKYKEEVGGEKELRSAKKLFVVANAVTNLSGETMSIREGQVEHDRRTRELYQLVERLKNENQCVACDLSGADLSGLDLHDADLERAKLFNANLREADLKNANLKGTDLRKADLRDADLRNIDLYKANLSYANLTGADLVGALLDSAELLGVQGLGQGE
ncbi:MAG: pentapeptide repeat-containing protein [Desulfobulbaceae bacterium]|nr:pentapeptide repeat-containing protein [Desulfobulbaceae bacterium]